MSKVLYAFAVVISCLEGSGAINIHWALFAAVAAVAAGLLVDR